MDTLNLTIYGDNQQQPEDTPITALFAGFTNKTQIDKYDIPFIQIKHDGILYRVNIASTHEKFEKIQQFTEEESGQHQCIHLLELKNISSSGRVLSLENAAGRLVATTQILTSPIPEYPHLTEDEAYCYGIIVKPDDQGKEYTPILSKAQEVIAREADKKSMFILVDVENVRSIRTRLDNGFRIIGYNSVKYSPSAAVKGRLLLAKKLGAETLPSNALKQAERIRAQKTLILSSDREARLQDQPDEIALSSSISGKVDTNADLLLEKVLAAGYIGTGLLQSAEYAAENSRQHLFIFQRKGSLPFTETISPPIHAHSEFGRLRQVIVSYSPEAALIKPEYATNSVAQSNVGNIDAIAFKEEHEGLLKALISLGVDIVRTSSFVSDGRTAIFTRDPAFTLGEMFVIGKSAEKTRRYEASGIRRLSYKVNTVEIGKDEDAFIEGGDIIFLGNNTLAVGLGQRTNEKGLQRLAQAFLQYTFIGVKHTNLHLDVLFTVTGHQKALADVTRLPPAFLTFLRDVAGYEIIVADPQEQITLGCNVLAIDNNKVIAVSENSITNQRLRANGVEVIEVSMPNVIKKGGGPRCLTCPTRRDST